MDYDILDGYLSGEEGVEEPVYVEEDPEVRAALASAPARPPAPTPTGYDINNCIAALRLQ